MPHPSFLTLFRCATRITQWIAVCAFACAGAAAHADAQKKDASEFDAAVFDESIAPVLESRCLRCHRGVAARGGLRLETRDDLLTGGDSGPALEPGDADASLLLDMIAGDEPLMPEEGEPLSDVEVDHLRQWIDAGAPWPDGRKLVAMAGEADVWWSLEPIRVTRPPRESNAWVVNVIDQFIHARLVDAGLTPSPAADRRTLIRRLYFDLLGLPPSPEAVHGFVNDTHPAAYERLVDELLASPHYGERWARHWLDVAHYGETHGYDKDKRRDHAWPYRDYVIRALNSDKPYARFLREQIAGDALFPDDPDGIVATGFVVAGPWDFVGHVELREGTVEKRKTRLLDRDDMVTTTLSTFASTTVHCARCHDHPFDPIAQKEYYQLQAVFAGVERAERTYPDPATERRRADVKSRIAMLNRRLDEVDARIAARMTPRLSQLRSEIDEIERQLADLPDAFATPDDVQESPTNGYHSAIASSADVTKHVTIDLGEPMNFDRLRLIPARPTDFPDTPGFGFPLRFRVEQSLEPDFSDAVLLADFTDADYPNPGNRSVTIDASEAPVRYVRLTAEKLWERTNDYALALAELRVERGDENLAAGATVTAHDTIDAGRWHTKNLVDGFSSRHQLPALNSDAAQAERRRIRLLGDLHQTTKAFDTQYQSTIPADLIDQQAALRQQIDSDTETLAVIEDAKVYAAVSVEPRPIHVLHRGEVDAPGEAVVPAALDCVACVDTDASVDAAAPGPQRRAALAAWLADAEHPLVWRSIANRVWQYHFNRPLVDTPNDFGRNGSLPSHPELLDYLADYLRRRDGSLKALHRLIVTSATYRQSSADRAQAIAIDIDNRMLWRMNRRRLESEAVRDATLAVAGALERTMSGPSFEPFGFEDDHSPRYDYRAAGADRHTRRSIYRFLVRSVPDPFMETLDCPDPSLSAPVRSTTITALQALALLNNPFMVRQAQAFADRLQAIPNTTDSERVIRAFELALSRPPTDDERVALSRYAQRHGWANACRLIFNLNEFVYVD